MARYISTYALYHPNDAYLEHGLSWGKHSYIKREGTPGNYRYFYAEDLKKAGRGLTSAAKGLVNKARGAVSTASRSARNAVQNAGRAASNAIGLTQRKNVQSTALRYAGARANRLARENSYDGSARSQREYSNAVGVESRAETAARDARIAYKKTPLGKIENALGVNGENLKRAVQNIPSDVKYEVSHFATSKIGIGKKSEVQAARQRLEAATRAYKSSGSVLGEDTPEWREYEAAMNAHRDAVLDYGETFLGSMTRLLKGRYYG